MQKNEEAGEELFKVRKDQEYLKKFFPSPEEVIDEIQEVASELFNENMDIKGIIVSEKESDGKTTTLYRNPFVIDTPVELTKFISIRLNFGNINAGKQRAFLLSFLKLVSLKRTLRLLLSEEGFEKILQGIHTREEKENMIKIKDLLIRLFFNPSEEESEEFIPPPTPPETEEYIEEEGEEGEGFWGIDTERFKEIAEKLSISVGDVSAVNTLMLFPEIEKFIESGQMPVGIVELDYITIEEAVEIIQTFKGASLEDVKNIVEMVKNTWKKDINTEETAQKLMGIISYIYWYLKKIKERALKVSDFLSNAGL